MNIKQINQALVDLIELYHSMEKEYDMDFTKEVGRVRTVITDLPEAAWKCEHKDLL